MSAADGFGYTHAVQYVDHEDKTRAIWAFTRDHATAFTIARALNMLNAWRGEFVAYDYRRGALTRPGDGS